MEFRLLGDLEVADGGRRLPLGGRKQRTLLAALLLDANHVVPADVLFEALWGDGVTTKAPGNLQALVSRLRRTLGPERIERHAGGYLLRVQDSEVDLHCFERLRAEARLLPPTSASERLRVALDLWRGSALADFTYDSWAGNEIRRLEELRVTALEERVQADIDAGQHGELVGELRGLVAEHPLREGFRRQLIVALYRSGRQAEALESYQAARRMLDEELGLEPSVALKELEAAVLRQDPSLDAPANGRGGARPAAESRPLPPRRAWVAGVAASALLAFTVAVGVVWALNREDAQPSAAAAAPQVAPAKTKGDEDDAQRQPAARASSHVTRVVPRRARARVVPPTSRRRPPQRAAAPTRQAAKPEAAARPAGSPVQPAKPKPAPKPVPRPAPYRATDDFEDPVTSDFWRSTGSAGVEVAERNGQLQFTFDAKASAEGEGWFGATYESRCRFQGDFDLRVDYELPQWPSANGVSLQATAWFGTHGLTIARQSSAGGEHHNSWTRKGAAVPTADVRGAFRLRRKNGFLFSYYREDGAWSVLRTFVFSDPVTVLLQAGSTNQLFADQAVTAAFDNFALTAPARPFC